ncbi:MAG: hypothetical protein ACWGMZ_00305 [Thermoguttaceae bacterium]
MTTKGGIASPEFAAYLQAEAEQRECDIAIVYQEEMEAQKYIDDNPLTIEELDDLVATSNPNPRLLEGDEECPF